MNLCLTLPEQPERTERAKAEFAKHNIPVKFVQAFHGWKSGLASTHPYEHDHPGSNYHIGPATIGIFISHIIAWSIVAAGDTNHAIIFEDDVILCDNFSERLKQATLDMPADTDVLFLGSCCCEGHIKQRMAGEVFEVRYPQCLHAYMITKHAAEVLLANYRDVYGPVDCLMRLGSFSGLKVYTVLPRMAEQLNTNLPL